MFILVKRIVRAKRGGGMKERCIFMFRYVHPRSVDSERGQGERVSMKEAGMEYGGGALLLTTSRKRARNEEGIAMLGSEGR